MATQSLLQYCLLQVEGIFDRQKPGCTLDRQGAVDKNSESHLKMGPPPLAYRSHRSPKENDGHLQIRIHDLGEAVPMIGCAGGSEAGRRVPLTTLVGAGAVAPRETPVLEVAMGLPAGVDEVLLPRKALSALAAIREESLAPTDRGSLLHQYLSIPSMQRGWTIVFAGGWHSC